jgi:hypothetical protein
MTRVGSQRHKKSIIAVVVVVVAVLVVVVVVVQYQIFESLVDIVTRFPPIKIINSTTR